MEKEPQFARNAWITVEVDGQKPAVVGGPKRKDGGFTVEVKLRKNGEVGPSLYVTGRYEAITDSFTVEVEPPAPRLGTLLYDMGGKPAGWHPGGDAAHDKDPSLDVLWPGEYGAEDGKLIVRLKR